MPGQPDWQRYQTSAGPLIYTGSSNPNNNFFATYVGSWRSLFLFANIEDPNALVRLNLNWFEDAQETQGLVGTALVLGNNTEYIKQIPVLARYLALSTTVLIGGTTNNVSMWIGPSLLEQYPYQYFSAQPLISQVNVSIGAGATTSFHPNLLGGGKKKLTIWPTNTSMRINIRYFDNSGVLQYLAVLSAPTANTQTEYTFTAPEAPWSVDVTNLAASAGTVHVFVTHAD